MKNLPVLNCIIRRKQNFEGVISMKSLKITATSLTLAMMLAAMPISAEAVTLKTENGIKYVQNDSGETKTYTGWIKKSGKRYYYKDGVMKKNCWLRVNGKRTYFLEKDGSMAVGKVKISGKEYEFGENGKLISNWKVIVNGNTLDLDSNAPYEDGDTLMIPVCELAEALGYKVSFDADNGTVVIDDDYIQKATLTSGSDTAVFEGHLKIIDMSREVTLSKPMKICGDCPYVPSDFFEEFFNDVIIGKDSVEISPSMMELDGD